MHEKQEEKLVSRNGQSIQVNHTTGKTETTKLKVKAATCNFARTQLILLVHAKTFKLGTKSTKKTGDLRILFFDLQSNLEDFWKSLLYHYVPLHRLILKYS